MEFVSAQGRQGVTSGIARRLAVVAIVFATIGGVVGATPASAAPTAGCDQGAVVGAESAAQQQFVAELNRLRQSRGLRTLVVNNAVTGQASGWSTVMSTANRLYHARDSGPNDGVEPGQDYVALVGQVVPDWRRVAENVGVSSIGGWCSAGELASATAAAVSTLHTALVNSPGHYGNMIGDFNQVGIGVEIDSDQLWVTARFALGSLPAPAPSYTNAQLGQADRYLDAVYQLFLGRPANGGEHSFWSAPVAGGDRVSLTRALSVSDEWAGTRVGALYRTVLGREAESSGRVNWVRAIAHGMRLESVASGIYGSQERFNLSGGTNRGYVEGLYRDILGREADAGGRSQWVGLLDRGQLSRTGVADAFYASVESRTARVTGLYQEILGRAPDAGGLAHWMREVTRLGDVALAATLASSQEYWNRASA